MLLKKRTHLTGRWTTELDFDPSTGNEEAGTTVFSGCFAYAALLLRKGKGDGAGEIVLQWIDPDSEQVKASEIYAPRQSRKWLISSLLRKFIPSGQKVLSSCASQ